MPYIYVYIYALYTYIGHIYIYALYVPCIYISTSWTARKAEKVLRIMLVVPALGGHYRLKLLYFKISFINW